MLTCYSALLYLLAVYGKQDTVHPDDILSMRKLSPTERLEWLLGQNECAAAHEAIKNLLGQNEEFLKLTNALEAELIKIFLDRESARKLMKEANGFGDYMFVALNHLGGNNRLHRLLVV